MIFYEKWLKDTTSDHLSDYTRRNEKEVPKIIRHRTATDKSF